VSAAVASSEQVIRRPLRLYALLVAFYTLLLGWWVYFFARLDERLLGDMDRDGIPLAPAARARLEQAADEAMRMFLFEGGFLGLLVLLSVFLVMRSVQRETLLARQQRNFVSAVTHELRSPLASVRLYIDSLLRNRGDPERVERYLRHAREDVERLGDMIEDILQTRRIAERGVEIARERVDLVELVERRLQRLRELHAERAADLKFVAGATASASASAPVIAQVDPQAICQVLDNLVSNALKYGGERGAVDIAVERQGGEAVLSVRDRGPGFGDDPARLSEPFVRGGDEQVRTRPGVGLGLFLVREIVAAHGGRLRFDQQLEGGGTRVSVSLPAGDAA